MRRKPVECGRIVHLPTEKADSLAAIRGDHQALLAIVHAQGQASAAAVDRLQTEQFGAVTRTSRRSPWREGRHNLAIAPT